MADNVIKRSGHFISVTLAGSVDFAITSVYPKGIDLVGIHFSPSSNSDKLIVTDGPGGPIILHAEVDSKGPIYRPVAGLKCKPFIDFSECQFSSPANAQVVFDISGWVG